MLAIPVSLTHWFNTLSPQSVLFKFCINETDYSIGVILDVLVDSQKFTGELLTHEVAQQSVDEFPSLGFISN